MEISHGKFFDELNGISKLIFPLSWKSSHDIETDADVGDSLSNIKNQCLEAIPCISPIHAKQNLIIPALEGNMKVGADHF